MPDIRRVIKAYLSVLECNMQINLSLFNINHCMLVCSVFTVFMYIADTKSGLYQK